MAVLWWLRPSHLSPLPEFQPSLQPGFWKLPRTWMLTSASLVYPYPALEPEDSFSEESSDECLVQLLGTGWAPQAPRLAENLQGIYAKANTAHPSQPHMPGNSPPVGSFPGVLQLQDKATGSSCPLPGPRLLGSNPRNLSAASQRHPLLHCKAVALPALPTPSLTSSSRATLPTAYLGRGLPAPLGLFYSPVSPRGCGSGKAGPSLSSLAISFCCGVDLEQVPGQRPAQGPRAEWAASTPSPLSTLQRGVWARP